MMFDTILRSLSLRRSVAGVYYELRTLRRMLEVVLREHGYETPTPSSAARRTRDSAPVDGEGEGEQLTGLLDEEQLARERAVEIMRARLSGKDAGTTWVEDPNR